MKVEIGLLLMLYFCSLVGIVRATGNPNKSLSREILNVGKQETKPIADTDKTGWKLETPTSRRSQVRKLETPTSRFVCDQAADMTLADGRTLDVGMDVRTIRRKKCVHICT
jgi:energy-converting hydrogenase Eha subunit F